MEFDVEVVKECLMRHGVVYTVRSYCSLNKFAVVEVDGKDYVREKVCQISVINDIAGYTELSGFKSKEEWWNKITQFGAQNGWLYKVTPLFPEEEVLIEYPCDQDFNSQVSRCKCNSDIEWPDETTEEFLRFIGCHCPKSVLACKAYQI